MTNHNDPYKQAVKQAYEKTPFLRDNLKPPDHIDPIEQALYLIGHKYGATGKQLPMRTILENLVEEVTAPLHKQLEQISDVLPCDLEDLCDDEE